MTRALIITLDNEFEVIDTSYFVSSYKKEHPHIEISLLTFTEHLEAANTIQGIDKVISINKTEIDNFYNNPLFSQGFAINRFLENIHDCYKTSWDEILNYSNNQISNLLSTVLDAKKVYGSTLSQTLNLNWSNDWAAYLNFNQKDSSSIIPTAFTKNFMTGTELIKDSIRLKTDSEYNNVASQNFMRIRRSKGQNYVYIVGLSLLADQSGNRIDIETLKNLIENFETSKSYKPVLIIGHDPEERKVCNQLNKLFNNKLISITADYEAMTSVIGNLDALVSMESVHSKIAEAINTRLIVVNNTNKLKSMIIPNNYQILTNDRPCFDEVNFILNNLYENELPVESITDHSKIYQTISDHLSTYFTQISGELNIANELNYHVARCFDFELMGQSTNKELLGHLAANTEKADLISFVEYNKTQLTKCVKVLLSTLRSLKGIKQSNDNKRSFVTYLDELMSYADSNALISTPVKLFNGKLENLNSVNQEQNFKEIESILFTLKANLQKLTNIFTLLLQDEKESFKEEEAQL